MATFGTLWNLILGLPGGRILGRRLSSSTIEALTNTQLFEILGTGTPGANTFLRGDGVWQAISTGIDVQTFTSSGNYIKPAGRSLALVVCVGGGGGGGSGRRGAVNTIRGGGGGGGAGTFNMRFCWITDLFDVHPVDVGSGGNGAAGITTDNTNGGIGQAGSPSQMAGVVLAAGGTGGGGGNPNTAATGGVTSSTFDTNRGPFFESGPGRPATGHTGNGQVGGFSNTPSALYGQFPHPTGGGGGASLSINGTWIAGSPGGSYFTDSKGFNESPASAATGAGNTGSAGGSITRHAVLFGLGGGGGGGIGGAGGLYGGGGGGGGGTNNGTLSGAGGAGGQGVVRVFSF